MQARLEAEGLVPKWVTGPLRPDQRRIKVAEATVKPKIKVADLQVGSGGGVGGSPTGPKLMLLTVIARGQLLQFFAP